MHARPAGPALSRRRFLATSSATMASSIIPQTAKAAGDITNLHAEVVLEAKKIGGGRDVTLKILAPQGSEENVRKAAVAFAADTGIAVDILTAPVDEIVTRMLIEKLSGTSSYDLALPATFGLPELAEAQAIRDLSDYAARHEPPALQETSLYAVGDYYKGRLYGYQTDGDAYLMFYRNDWLSDPGERARFEDLHGVALSVPTTWQDLDRTMAFFNRPDEGRYGGALFRSPNYVVWEWWMRFHAKGYWPVDNDFEPQIGNDAGVAALEELIAASRSLYPDAQANGLFENWQSYASGNIFCNVGWGGTQKFLNGADSPVRGKLTYAPPPGGFIDETLLRVSYFNWGWNYTVSSNSPETELAYLFSLYAVSPEISTASVQVAEGFFDPFRPEHYDDPVIQEIYAEPFLKAHHDSMSNAIPDFYVKGQGEYFDALRESIVAAALGDISPKDALHQAANQWRFTTQRLGRSGQTEQWRLLQDRYPAICKALLK